MDSGTTMAETDPSTIENVQTPVDAYPKLSQVHTLKKDQLKEHLRRSGQNTLGNKHTLQQRLRAFLKKRLVKQVVQSSLPCRDKYFDYLCIVDFECTCEEGANNTNYPHEIIEFPVVLLKTSTLEIVDEFHSYCKPVLNPVLSEFCSKLTGITQEQVDEAPEFPVVLEQVEKWLVDHELETHKYGYAFVTDGPWDFGRFFQLQMSHLKKPIPHHFRYWINIRRRFCQAFSCQKINLNGMLVVLDMTFEGRQHSGLDDARNLARVTRAMISKGVELRINEMIRRRNRLNNIRAEKLAQRQTGCPDQVLHSEPHLIENDSKQRSHSCLPYKVFTVSKMEFLMDVYERCLTCDEDENEDRDSTASSLNDLD